MVEDKKFLPFLAETTQIKSYVRGRVSLVTTDSYTTILTERVRLECGSLLVLWSLSSSLKFHVEGKRRT